MNYYYFLYLRFLVSLVLVFLLFRNSYQQDNKKIVDILAVILSFSISYNILFQYSFDFINYFKSITTYALAFILGGIICKIYFSKYYGRIIILIGVVLHILFALSEIVFSLKWIANGMFSFVSRTWLVNNLWNIAVITFWCRYWLFMQFPTIKFSLASKKDDPKDW